MDVYKSPESDLEHAEYGAESHIFWKVFFFLHCVIALLIPFVLFSFSEIHFLDYVDVAIFFPAILFSLFCYAYSKRIVSPKVYKWIFYAYVVWAVFYEILAPYVLGIPSYGEYAVIDLWLLFVPAFMVPTFLALYRLTQPIEMESANA